MIKKGTKPFLIVGIFGQKNDASVTVSRSSDPTCLIKIQPVSLQVVAWYITHTHTHNHFLVVVRTTHGLEQGSWSNQLIFFCRRRVESRSTQSILWTVSYLTSTMATGTPYCKPYRPSSCLTKNSLTFTSRFVRNRFPVCQPPSSKVTDVNRSHPLHF